MQVSGAQVELDGLFGRGQRVVRPPQAAVADAKVVQRAGEAGQEGGIGVGQPPVEPDGVFGRGQRVVAERGQQTLVERVGRGEWLDLAAGDETVDEAAMRSWGDSRTCRASVIRDLLRGRPTADPDPHGLRLRGARITGRLDLENLATDVSLELHDCLLEEGLLARDARLAAIVLVGCQIEHPAGIPLDGARLTCSVLSLDRARVHGHADVDAVDLHGAHIDGNLVCDGASLRNDSGPALFADGLQVSQDMFSPRRVHRCRRWRRWRGPPDRCPRRGSLVCDGASLRNDSGPALFADGLQVDLDMQCDRLTADGVNTGLCSAVTSADS